MVSLIELGVPVAIITDELSGFIDRLLGREIEYVENYVPSEMEERGAFIPFRQPFVVNEITALKLIPVSRCIYLD